MDKDLKREKVFKQVLLRVGCPEQTCAGGQCAKQPGGGTITLQGVNMHFKLGKTDQGKSAGELFIMSPGMAPVLGTPKALGLSTTSMDVSSVTDTFGAVRQVVAPETFADIVTIDDKSYEIRFYKPEARGASKSGVYEVAQGSVPTKAWRIEYADNNLKSTEIGGSGETYKYTADPEGKDWKLDKNGVSTEIRKNSEGSKSRAAAKSGSQRTVRKAVLDSSGKETSVTETVYKKSGKFELVVKETSDPDGAKISSDTEYYPDLDGKPGKPKKIVNHDGSWTRYEYDESGRKIKEIRPYLNAGPNAPVGSSLVTEYDYTPLSGDSNLSSDKGSARTITEKTIGVVTSKSYHVYILEPGGSKKEITERCSGGIPSGSPLPPGEGQGEGIKPFGDPSNQRTVNIYFPSTASKLEAGRLKTSESSDGRITNYSYAYGRFTKGSNPASSKFVAGTGSDVQETVVTGTKNLPEGVTNKTTMEVRITDSLGYAQMEETKVFSGTGYERISCKTHNYDDLGREIETFSSDGTKTSKTWSCCGPETETSAEGIVTRFTLDALKRITARETEGISGSVRTSYIYDAAGRKVSETVTAGDITMTSSTKYDGAGRVVSSKDASGLEVTYAYSSDGRTTTVTRPGGVTETTERYPDGKTKSVTGTGVTAQYYEYGVDADGSSWTITRIGSPDSPMYEKTVSDISGRTIRSEKPGPKGIEITKNYYDSNGRLVKTETPGMASTLYVYNDLGETIRTGLDVDGNGVLEPASQDRISESETQFKKIGSDWWQESSNRIYAEENSATPKNTGLNRSRLTGLGATNLTAESESFDLNGNKSSSKTFTDAANKTVTNQVLVGRAEPAKPDISVSRFGLMVSNTDSAGVEMKFEYDSLGRKIKTKDPRTGASITHFDSKGRVDFVADAAGNKTEFGYDETTGRKVWEKNAAGKFTRYAYDAKGRISKTWGDSVYPVSYSYDETGRMVSMTTYRPEPASGTGWNGETFPENATGDTTKWHYDPATGLLLAKEYADGTKTEYRYAEAGRLDSRIWARKNGANAVSTSYVYDSSTASLNKIDYSDETADITFSYDRIGRQKSITDAVGTRTFAYNDSLQLQSEKIEGLTPATITRLYEIDGVKGRPKGFAVEKTGDARYEISYGYDPSGRIKTLSWNAGGKVDTATYDYVENSHLLSSMKTGSGFATANTYEDHRNVKTAVSNSFGNTAVSTYTYEYDELGRRKSVKNSGSAFASANFNIYGYNDRSEVTASNSFTGEDLANKNNPLADRGRAYNYDPIGNRKTAIEAASNFAYTANSLNQYESISGGANPETPAYDLDGNMTVAKGIVYTYNAENRLIEAAPQNPQQGSIKSTYIYDYMGRRVKKTLFTYSSGSWQKQKDQSFIYDGWNMVKESEKASDSSPEVPVYYVWGLDLSQSMQGAGGVGGLIASVKSGNEYLYSFDANGNVGQMVKSTDGSIAARYEYDPFGKTLFAEGQMAGENPYRFSTKYLDGDTGLYYYGFRYYDVELGRWINRDPIGEIGGMNIFGFVNNDSINFYDYLGQLRIYYDSYGQEVCRSQVLWPFVTKYIEGPNGKHQYGGKNYWEVWDFEHEYLPRSYSGAVDEKQESQMKAFIDEKINDDYMWAPIPYLPESIESFGFISTVGLVLETSPQRRAWDYKRRLIDKDKWYIYKDRAYLHDSIGNIVWGAIMKQFGWPEKISKMG